MIDRHFAPELDLAARCWRTWCCLGVGLTVLAISPAVAQPPPSCQPVTSAIRARLGLDEFYRKIIEDRGIVFVGSQQVSNMALAEACFLIDRMLQGNGRLRRELADAGVRVAVMAPTELTTDVPEHRHLRPKAYWDRRARGLGASRKTPVVSCGEENLLELDGDPYAGESILIHEFAHAVDTLGMAGRPEFDEKLKAAYAYAIAAGRWRDSYAATNAAEYWAEGVQSWFECNAKPNKHHIDVRTRAQIKPYDPELAELLAETFGDNDWRYEPPTVRDPALHLVGREQLPNRRFEWPAELASKSADELKASADDGD